jgi:hypothetical protein
MTRIIKHDWALSKSARDMFADLIQAGFDPDLAISIMEQTLTDEALYSLEGNEDE